MTEDALYRKLNDGSHSSSTYHKKDGTNVRGILKSELREETKQIDRSDIFNFPVDDNLQVR